MDCIYCEQPITDGAYRLYGGETLHPLCYARLGLEMYADLKQEIPAAFGVPAELLRAPISSVNHEAQMRAEFDALFGKRKT